MTDLPAPTAAPKLRLWPILAALVLGLLLGVLAHGRVADGSPVVEAARLVGSLWLNALRLTLVPLVFSLVVTGVAAAVSSHVGGRLGRRIALSFVALLLLSAVLAALLGPLLLDLGPSPDLALAPTARVEVPAATAWILGLVPPNLVNAAAEGAIVPVVLFALVFALAAVKLGHEAAPVLGFFKALAAVMIRLVQWVLVLAPLGIFGLAFVLGATTGLGAGAFIGWYVVVQIAVTLTLAALMIPLALRSGVRLSAFAREAAQPLAIAASTQSSLAALPAMVTAAARLGLPERSAGVVLPLAVALFRIAAPASIVIVTLALARLAQVELGLLQVAVIIGLATLNTLVIAGLPNQITFFAAYAPPALAVGVPIELLPIFLAIDAIPDMFYTVTNVTADLAVTSFVSRDAAEGPEEATS
ncbi:dicarboxylate/amino acid:cation symporter [Sphingomonas rosea]|uniref:Dicarboxylate/amino acid:cation symporter n=1 Tax=Sphingomonas rosea TaxID=335605 RepID=A0ABP7UIW4_9SPHN